MSQAQQMLVAQFSLARQTALSRGHAVELRLYRFGDPEQPGESANQPATGQFRGVQVFDVPDNGVAVPVEKMQRLPSMMIMNPTIHLSTILGGDGQTPRSPSAQDPELPRGIGRNYQFVTVRFQPNGSTTLPATGSMAWFLTVHPLVDGATSTTAPANFFTLQLDPVSGTFKVVRPNAS
jgi:uncharacterized protein (TIGR02596 family)